MCLYIACGGQSRLYRRALVGLRCSQAARGLWMRVQPTSGVHAQGVLRGEPKGRRVSLQQRRGHAGDVAAAREKHAPESVA